MFRVFYIQCYSSSNIFLQITLSRDFFPPYRWKKVHSWWSGGSWKLKILGTLLRRLPTDSKVVVDEPLLHNYGMGSRQQRVHEKWGLHIITSPESRQWCQNELDYERKVSFPPFINLWNIRLNDTTSIVKINWRSFVVKKIVADTSNWGFFPLLFSLP